MFSKTRLLTCARYPSSEASEQGVLPEDVLEGNESVTEEQRSRMELAQSLVGLMLFTKEKHAKSMILIEGRRGPGNPGFFEQLDSVRKEPVSRLCIKRG